MNSFAKSVERVFKSLLTAVLAVSLCPLMPSEEAHAQEAGDTSEPAVPSRGADGDAAKADNPNSENPTLAVEDDSSDNGSIALQSDESGAPIVNWTTSGTCQWMIDAGGCLTIEPLSGAASGELGSHGWSEMKDSVTSVVIKNRVISSPDDCRNMFSEFRNLKEADLSGFDTSNATSMVNFFACCSSLRSVNLSGLDTSKVTGMGGMFLACESLTSLDLSSLDTSNVRIMGGMFDGCLSLSSLDLSSFNTSNVTDMNSMFGYCPELQTINLSSFDTSNTTGMSWMFWGCSKLQSLDLSNFNTLKVTDMDSMFKGCSSLTSLDMSGFDTSNVTNMNDIFAGCKSLTSLNLSGFSTSNTTNMDSMFYGCSELRSLDLSSFDTSKVTSMEHMLSGCSRLQALDLSSFDTSNATNMEDMFKDLSSLHLVKMGKGFSFHRSDSSSSILPSPSGQGLTGSWVNSYNKKVYPSSAIPDNVAADYYAQGTVSSSSVAIDTSSEKFTGQPITKAIDSDLIEGIDYEVHYKSNVEAGTATVKVEGAGGCTGSLVRTFSIDKADPAYAVPGPIAAIARQTLSDLELPDGFKWQDALSTNVGGKGSRSFSVSYTPNDTANYNVVRNIPVTVDVSAIEVAVPDIANLVYNGSLQQAAVPDNPGYHIVSNDGGTDAGSYSVTLAITDTDFYEWADGTNADKAVEYAIAPEDIDDATAGEIADQIGPDGPAEPKPVLTFNGQTLVEGRDYDLSYEGADESGKATAIVKGKGNFTGEKRIPYLVAKYSLSNAVGRIPSTRYAEADLPVKPAPIIQSSEEPQERLLQEGVDYELSYEGGEAIGSGKVVATGIGDYAGVLEFPFEVKDRIDISHGFDYGIESTLRFYTGDPIEPKISFYQGNLVERRDFEVRYENNTHPGTATAIVSGAGRYKGEVEETFYIVNRSVADLSHGASITFKSVTRTDGYNVFPYRGIAVEPEFTVNYSNSAGYCALELGKDYEVSYSDNDGVGIATVTVTGINGVTGSISKQYKIVGNGGIDVSLLRLGSRSLDQGEYLYTGSWVRPKLTWDNNFVEGTDYVLSYADNKEVGTGTVIVHGIGNYTGTAKIPFNIVEKFGFPQFNDVCIADYPEAVAYTGEPVEPKLSLRDKDTGEELVEGRDYRVRYENNVNYGMAIIHVYEGSGSSNQGSKYRGTAAYAFQIVKTKVEEPVAATGLVYNGLSQMGVAPAGNYTVKSGAASAAGNYVATISLNDKESYAWLGSGNSDDIQIPWSIAPAEIGKASIAAIGARTWTGSQIKPEPIVSFNGKALEKNVDYILSYGENVSPGKGTVTVTAVEGGNFTGSVTVEFDIEKKAVPAPIFTDVDYSDTSWYGDAVTFVAEKGLITGYSGTTLFGVGDVLTRAQLATILWRNACPDEYASYDPETAKDTTGIDGSADGMYYTAAANWAVKNGVITGFDREDGSKDFAADDDVSFEQLVTILSRLCATPEELSAAGSDLSAFADGDLASSWSRGAFAWAADKGLVQGYDEPTGKYLRPGDPVARERVAVVLMRAFEMGVLK